MKYIYVILVVILSFYSCTPPLYIPNTTNTPSLLKQGDSEVGISTGSNGWDGQFATAITNKFDIMLNGSFASHTNDSSNNYNKHQFIEFGLGYTNVFNKENLESDDMKYFFSVYSGGGSGISEGLVEFSNIFNADLTHSNAVEGEYQRFFFQPSIGMSNKTIDLSFSIRASWVNFTNMNNNLEADWQSSYNENGAYHNIFYEPTVTFKVGGNHFKFFTQMGASIGATDNTKIAFRQRPLIVIFGIQGNFNWK